MQHIDSSLERSQGAAEELPVTDVAPGFAEWGKLVAVLVASVERRARAAEFEERLCALERRAQAFRWPTAEANAPSPTAVQRLAERLAWASQARAERLIPSLPAVQNLAWRLARATLQAQAERPLDRPAPARAPARIRAPRVRCRCHPGRRRSSRCPRVSGDDDPDPGDSPPLGAQRGGLRHALRDAGYRGGRERFGSGAAPC
jgi:hypothetical protein